MRYLADSEITETMLQILSDWAAPYRIADTKMLLLESWKRAIQKSMEGLLRTLLSSSTERNTYGYLATLQQSAVLPDGIACMYDQVPGTKWTVSELSDFFRDVMMILSNDCMIAIFVDGLDEFGRYRSDREELVSLFLGLTSFPNIKMCLSSRPWSEFKDSLDTFPHLKLENLSKGDMNDFVRAELGNCRAFQDLARVAPDEVRNLQDHLATKSNGVFFWLFLVTRRLKSAAQDGTSLRKLADMLDEMPPDLDKFFQHMLDRIPDADRVQASKIFQVVLGSDAGCLPSLMALSFTEEDSPDFALSDAIRGESRPQILSRTVAFRRRLDSQCMDLLWCPQGAENAELLGWDGASVYFLHRSVKDFLESDSSRNTLYSYTRACSNSTQHGTCAIPTCHR